MTQTAIAKEAKITQPTLSRILSGKRSPRLATARRLEKVTGVSLHIWRGGDVNAIWAALNGVNIFPARNKTSNNPA